MPGIKSLNFFIFFSEYPNSISFIVSLEIRVGYIPLDIREYPGSSWSSSIAANNSSFELGLKYFFLHCL